MLIWVKYASLALVVLQYLACTTTNQMHRDNGRYKSQAIDSLPPTIIPPQIEPADSNTYIDTTSMIQHDGFHLSTHQPGFVVSENEWNKQEKSKANQFEELRHTGFKELEVAIDDYGNNNYLDRDF
ncbi:MAG: hypothetical protein HC819_23055 [Cyclobacteriaceae bacterium]|nr:hypothetical protein [Cyclobacteriaceae bacterium]